MDNIETIGKVQLDLSRYPGEDYYCDGEVEDEILRIARDCSPVEYPGIIEESANWPVLYHLSSLRENIVEWLPMDKTMKVLEIGAGAGAITGAFAKKAGEVVCVDLSKKRSSINAYRHSDAENVTIHVGNFMDVEPDLPDDFDYICLIGVFEYSQSYIGGKTPYESFLNIIKKHLNPGGRIVIAIENRLGLKYFAGCREDHVGEYFASIADYPEGGAARCFARETLIEYAKKCGFREGEDSSSPLGIHMYYPYPDYKFMTTLYSDKRLPMVGELSSNIRNFDRDRLMLFDEKRAFDSLIKDDYFKIFSNSFLMVLGPDTDVDYVKYSNDRAEKYAIKTVQRTIKAPTGSVKTIEKHALTENARQHVVSIFDSYGKLHTRYDDDSVLKINNCRLAGDCITFDYLEGITLEELLDNCLENDDFDGFLRMFRDYYKRISFNAHMNVADYDLIFSNIIVSPDGTWNLIDYEWTFDRVIEPKEQAFRAIYCYVLEDEKRQKLNLDMILREIDVTEGEAGDYRQKEMDFQKLVTGKHLAMQEMREKIGNPIYTLDQLHMTTPAEKRKGMVQIYQDFGSGFSEAHSFLKDEYEFQTQIEIGCRNLRIDPCSDYCIVLINSIKWNGKDIPLKGRHISTNGRKIGENLYAFATEDPNITLKLGDVDRELMNLLDISMEVTRVPEAVAMRLK